MFILLTDFTVFFDLKKKMYNPETCKYYFILTHNENTAELNTTITVLLFPIMVIQHLSNDVTHTHHN